MTVWRLSTPLFPPLTGDGARLTGGRWNSPGVPVIYASQHLALAVMETLVHARPGTLPDNLAAFEIDVPNEMIEPLDILGLRAGWRTNLGETRRIGDAWLLSRRSLGLAVPSVVVPSAGERNILLNPLHEAATLLKIVSSEPFEFDDRLR